MPHVARAYAPAVPAHLVDRVVFSTLASEKRGCLRDAAIADKHDRSAFLMCQLHAGMPDTWGGARAAGPIMTAYT